MAGAFVLPRLAGVAHDYLYVGVKQRLAPGIVRDISIKRAHDVDLKKPGGSDGMTPTTNGERPVDVDITLEYWDDPGAPDDSVAIAANVGQFLGFLFPDGKPPTPKDCSHPKLALHGVRSLFFLEWDGPTEIGFSHWQVKLKAVNFKPPSKKSATNTPKKSEAASPGNTLFTPPKIAIDTGGLLSKWVPPKPPTASKPRP